MFLSANGFSIYDVATERSNVPKGKGVSPVRIVYTMSSAVWLSRLDVKILIIKSAINKELITGR